MTEPIEKKFQNLDYVVQYPENRNSREKWPLVIYLHGAGGRGRNVELIRTHPFFQEGQPWSHGVLAVAPQCYADSWFDIFEQLQEFVKFAVHGEYVDQDRVYLMGASMGGYATWQLAMTCPQLFAAIVPICGGGMYWNAERLKNLEVWAFHGFLDPCVSYQESQKMVDAVNRLGGSARLTIYEDGNHNAWSPTFMDQNMWKWLTAQKRKKQSQPVISLGINDVKNFG